MSSSTRAKHWAWSQLDLSRSELLLLLAMADHVGETLLCYASLKNLAVMARMSARTAERTAERLVSLGKLEATIRPGRTTLFRLLVPGDFGKEMPARTRRKRGGETPDKMSGVDDGASGSEQARTTDTVSGVTHDKMSEVGPPTFCREPPSKRRGTPDKMSDDSSLNPFLNNPSSRASAPATGAPLTREEHRRTVLLRHRALTAGVSPPTQSESLDDAERRIAEAETRLLQERVEQQRRQRAAAQAEQSAAPDAAHEDAA